MHSVYTNLVEIPVSCSCYSRTNKFIGTQQKIFEIPFSFVGMCGDNGWWPGGGVGACTGGDSNNTTRDETGGLVQNFWGREVVASLESSFPKLRRFLRERVDLRGDKKNHF